VYLNGQELGMHPYGYTSFFYDLTPHLNPGAANVLAVRVDQSQHRNSRWYAGSGIYRHVWMHVTGPVHVAPWGVFVRTPEVNAKLAKAVVETRVVNESAAVSSVLVRTEVFTAANQSKGHTESRAEVKPGETVTVNQDLAIEAPALWSVESPNLHRAVTRLMDGDRVVDEVTITFGVRSIAWSAEKGFLLN